MRVTALYGGCYTIPMGLCYEGGFGELTAAPVLRLPGVHLPWGPGGWTRWESVAGLSRHSLPYRFPLDPGLPQRLCRKEVPHKPRRIGLASCAGLPNAADRFPTSAPHRRCRP